ncbi:Tc toxin subunit A [Pseudomonas urmiensis]|uniref:Tc toxin subunit A n=1 Tax=Pseudomonas urmiensis TaxID=2745493 RepID=UPI003D0DF15E
MNELTSPAAGTTPAEKNDAATYMRLFPDDQTRCAPGALMANNSRLAYLVHLKELIQAFEVRAKISAPITLLKRRPDLLALTLDDKNSRKILPKVRLALGLLEGRAKEALTAKQTLPTMVAKGLYNANVPYHAAWESIKATLAAKSMPLWDVLSSAQATYPSFTFDNLTQAAQRSATSLSNGFAPQLQAVLLSENGQDSLALTSVDTTRKMAKALGLTSAALRQSAISSRFQRMRTARHR